MNKIYLSYGAGVISEALRLWLLENERPFEAVWVDHGCDWPETRDFAYSIPGLTILKPDVEGYDNLYDYCLNYKMVPSFMNRWCTDKFKVSVLYKYFKRPCFVYIGYSSDEEHRAKNSKNKEIFNQFPFLLMRWNRQDSIDYIKKLGKTVPMRSGCWFCPFQKKEQWELLANRHPDLFKKAKNLEKLNMEYRKKQGKIPLTISSNKKSLPCLIKEGQMSLF